MKKKTRYLIVYKITGRAAKCHQNLVKKISRLFREYECKNEKLPTHATLKYSFETDNIAEIENIIKSFVKKQKPAKIEMRGFDHFHNSVIFSKLKFSKEAKEIQKKLIKELKTNGLPIKKDDAYWKPHATITFISKKDNFEKIWNHLHSLDKQKFDLKFDNITILKKPRKLWKTHKRFKIK